MHVSSKQVNRGERGSLKTLKSVGSVLRGGDGSLYWRASPPGPTEKTLDALLSILDEDERE